MQIQLFPAQSVHANILSRFVSCKAKATWWLFVGRSTVVRQAMLRRVTLRYPVITLLTEKRSCCSEIRPSSRGGDHWLGEPCRYLHKQRCSRRRDGRSGKSYSKRCSASTHTFFTGIDLFTPTLTTCIRLMQRSHEALCIEWPTPAPSLVLLWEVICSWG